MCTHPTRNSTDASNLRILYYNPRSLLPKFYNLLASTLTLDPHIICIVETWLSGEIENNELYIPGFQLYRHDRNRHGGGVLIYVSAMFSVPVLPSPTPPLELLTLSILRDNFKVHVCLFYRPPSSSALIFDTLFSHLESINVGQLSNFILLGDFNVNHFNMSHPMHSNLCILSSLYCLKQTVTGPTHEHHDGNTSTIDLVFMSEPSMLQSCDTIPPLSNSDHLGITVTLKRKPAKAEKTKGRLIWRYSFADWMKACQIVAQTVHDDNG